MPHSGTRFAVYTALAGNLLIAVLKFAAAAWTGSSAMLSEGFHSVVDTGNQVLLLYGQHRAAVPPDEDHPLGHGREVYFWSFVVAILIFGLGAGLSCYEGVRHILEPRPIEHVTATYVVYGISFLLEAGSWFVSFRNFARAKGGATFWGAIHESKDAPALVVLLEDTAAMAGILIAVVGTILSVLLRAPFFDGAASIGIGLLLGFTATLLARRSKDLLIGETASDKTSQRIRQTVCAFDGIRGVGPVTAIHLSPDQVVAMIPVDFDPKLGSNDVEDTAAKIETAVKRNDGRVVAVYLKPQRLPSRCKETQYSN